MGKATWGALKFTVFLKNTGQREMTCKRQKIVKRKSLKKEKRKTGSKFLPLLYFTQIRIYKPLFPSGVF